MQIISIRDKRFHTVCPLFFTAYPNTAPLIEPHRIPHLQQLKALSNFIARSNKYCSIYYTQIK